MSAEPEENSEFPEKSEEIPKDKIQAANPIQSASDFMSSKAQTQGAEASQVFRIMQGGKSQIVQLKLQQYPQPNQKSDNSNSSSTTKPAKLSQMKLIKAIPATSKANNKSVPQVVYLSNITTNNTNTSNNSLLVKPGSLIIKGKLPAIPKVATSGTKIMPTFMLQTPGNAKPTTATTTSKPSYSYENAKSTSTTIKSNQSLLANNKQKLVVSKMSTKPSSSNVIMPSQMTSNSYFNIKIENGKVKSDSINTNTKNINKELPPLQLFNSDTSLSSDAIQADEKSKTNDILNVNDNKLSIPEPSKKESADCLKLYEDVARLSKLKIPTSTSLTPISPSSKKCTITKRSNSDSVTEDKSHVEKNRRGSMPLDHSLVHRDVTTTVFSKSLLVQNETKLSIKTESTAAKTFEHKIKIESDPDINMRNVEFSKNLVEQETVKSMKQPRMKKQQLQVKKDFNDMSPEIIKDSSSRSLLISKANIKPKQKHKIQLDTASKPEKNLQEKRGLDNTLPDPIRKLSWRNGIGTLEMSDLHFRKNEFGFFDILDELEYDAILTGRKDSKYHTPLAKRIEQHGRDKKPASAEDIYKCDECGCYGMAVEFVSPNFCSTACTDEYTVKKDTRNKQREKEINLMKKQTKGNFANLSEAVSANLQTDSDEEVKTREIQRSINCPWISSKIGFSWSKYLDYNKAKSAPTRAFYVKEPFPYQKNLFRVGMKMEAIDPIHQSYFCVVSVVEVQGYRIRLRFDNYPDIYNFWVNADSSDIKPVGWCEKNNHVLHPPKGYNKESFNWAHYLKECKSPCAPKMAFSHVSNETVCPSGFRIGMKLEAVDRRNSNLVCVASVADILDTRVLIHFDSWDEIYDYWAEPSSPYIHPVGWCKENDFNLTPPSTFTDPEKFSWENYLKETKSSAVPARAFKNRPSSQFREGMKLEAVDKRVPFLVRVATIIKVVEHELRISFDGWPDRYSFWIDDDSPDIHPVGWCSKTGHALEPPLVPADLELKSDCGTPGCIGLGNITDLKQSRHRTAQDCPYAPSNMDKCDIPDRFSDAETSIAEIPVSKSYGSKRSRESSTSSLSFSKVRNSHELLDGIKMEPLSLSEDEENSPITFSNSLTKKYSLVKERSSSSEYRSSSRISVNDIEDESPPKKIRLSNDHVFDLNIESNISHFPLSGEVKTEINDEIRNELKTSVFEPSFIPFGYPEDLWVKYSEPLQYTISMRKQSNPRTWSASDVAEFVNQIPNCSDCGKLFKKQGIDGESFLLLKQQDLLSCGLKLGPALKVYNTVNMLRNIIKTKLVA